jgi:hypothetical protein
MQRTDLGISVIRIHTQIPNEALSQGLPEGETRMAAAGRTLEARVEKAARAILDTMEAIA